MICWDVRLELPWLAAGKLEESRKTAVEQHLSFCEGCRFEWQDHQLVWQCLKACEDADPPAEMHARIVNAIQALGGGQAKKHRVRRSNDKRKDRR